MRVSSGLGCLHSWRVGGLAGGRGGGGVTGSETPLLVLSWGDIQDCLCKGGISKLNMRGLLACKESEEVTRWH